RLALRRAAINCHDRYTGSLGRTEATRQSIDGARANHQTINPARDSILAASQLYGVFVLAVERQDRQAAVLRGRRRGAIEHDREERKAESRDGIPDVQRALLSS